jgi:hypothetical protein
MTEKPRLSLTKSFDEESFKKFYEYIIGRPLDEEEEKELHEEYEKELSNEK